MFITIRRISNVYLVSRTATGAVDGEWAAKAWDEVLQLVKEAEPCEEIVRPGGLIEADEG